MNVLKALYANQYYELKPKGKEAAARTNGTRILGLCLSIDFILLAVVVMVISPELADAFSDLIKDIFGRRQGRQVAKVVVLVPFLIFLPLVRYTLGTATSYASIIAEFESKPEAAQKRISKKGLVFAIVSFANLFVAAALALIFFA